MATAPADRHHRHAGFVDERDERDELDELGNVGVVHRRHRGQMRTGYPAVQSQTLAARGQVKQGQ